MFQADFSHRRLRLGSAREQCLQCIDLDVDGVKTRCHVLFVNAVAKAKAHYHHGDLRRALLEAALESIVEGGISALSLREVARRAGVSQTAPYHHFADRAALVAAIAMDGYAILTELMREACLAAGDDPLQKLAATGRAYAHFAFSHRAHFDVMFRPELHDPEGNPELHACGETALTILVMVLIECQQAGKAPQGDPMELALIAWSSVHGLASLWLDGPLSKMQDKFHVDGNAAADLVASRMATMLAALAAVQAK